MSDIALTKDIAKALKVDVRTVQIWVANGKLPQPTEKISSGKGRPHMGWKIPSLPKGVREAILEHNIHNFAPQPGTSPAVSIPASHDLKDWQRKTAEARAAIIHEVKRLAAMAGTERAIQAVIALAANNELQEQLQRLVPVANAKAGSEGKRTLSRRSIYRWMNDAESGFSGLAPRLRTETRVPAWAPALLSLYQQPQKPTLKKCLDDLPRLLQGGIKAPSYWAAQRFLDKMSKLDLERGRMGPRELKSVRAYVKRDTSQMWPGDAYTADGHTFDAEIAHPAHGRPFRPEITSILDIATRRAVGWSIDLAESTWAVLDALRNAVETGGIPAIFYVDNGSGYKNAMMADEATGFMARLGITISHSLPYNSQARGIIERSHQTIWVRGAKDLPTYMGASMDREAKHSAFKITRADIKSAGASRLLMPWAEFTAWCQMQVDTYNDRPHRGLPKITDASGKRRHQTPNEAWATAITEGWKPVEVEAQESADLFRPYKEVTTRRALVQLFSNSYFHRDLEHHHGEKVLVGYDIHDANHVWVRDRAGRLICVAEFEGNKRSYFPVSALEQAAEKRAKGRIKRAEVKIEEAEAELNPPALIEYRAAEQLPPMDIPAAIEPAHLIQQPVAEPRPNLAQMGDYSLLTWLADHPEDWNDGFRNYFASQARNGSRTISNALDEYGLWGELEKRDFKVAV